MLTIFGPIQWAFSLLPKWEGAWAKWLTRYLTVHFYGAMLYFVGYFYYLTHSISDKLCIYISHTQQTCTKISIKKIKWRCCEGILAGQYWKNGCFPFSVVLSFFSCLELFSLKFLSSDFIRFRSHHLARSCDVWYIFKSKIKSFSETFKYDYWHKIILKW